MGNISEVLSHIILDIPLILPPIVDIIALILPHVLNISLIWSHFQYFTDIVTLLINSDIWKITVKVKNVDDESNLSHSFALLIFGASIQIH